MSLVVLIRPNAEEPGPKERAGLFATVVAANQTPTTKLTLVVPLPPMLRVWKFLAPSTW